MIEKPDTIEQEIMDLFRKKFPKRVDRDVWMCKYMMALTDIHLIEGLIGRRQKLRKSNLILDDTLGLEDENKQLDKKVKEVIKEKKELF